MLERCGKIAEAIDLLGQKLSRLLDSFETAAASNAAELILAEQCLQDGIDICKRSRKRLGEEEREQLWYKLFDELIRRRCKALLAQTSSQEDIRANEDVLNGFTRLTHHYMLQVMGHIDTCHLLQRLVTRSRPAADYGEYRDVISGWLESSYFDNEIASAAALCLRQDTHNMYVRARKVRSGSFFPRQGACSVCRRPLHEIVPVSVDAGLMEDLPASMSVLAFECGHFYHDACLHVKPFL